MGRRQIQLALETQLLGDVRVEFFHAGGTDFLEHLLPHAGFGIRNVGMRDRLFLFRHALLLFLCSRLVRRGASPHAGH
jgi:hypothetical protein